MTSLPASDRRFVLVAGLFFLAALVLQLPGHVPYDGIVVWHEAETHTLYAQHPAALVLIWRLCEAVMRGPALVTALSLGVLWLAIGLLLQRHRPPLWAAVLFGLIVLLWPPLLATSAVAVKDVLGAHLVLLAMVLAKGERRGVWFAAFAAGTLAFLLRYQFGLVLPLLGVMAWRTENRTALLAGLGGIVFTLVVVNALVAALFIKTGPGDVMLSLRKIAIFDIAGTVVQDSSTPLTILAAHHIATDTLKAEMIASYSPARVDTLWQTGESGTITPTSGVFGRLYALSDATIFAQWRATLGDRPGAFLAHRGAAFARVIGLGDIWQCRPLTLGISWLPRPAAQAVEAKSFAAPWSAQFGRMLPVSLTFRVIAYLALLAVILWTGPQEARLLAGFALLYELSFFFLPQACEVRYGYPVILAAVVAGAVALERRFV